jgi:hypothetical protein
MKTTVIHSTRYRMIQVSSHLIDLPSPRNIKSSTISNFPEISLFNNRPKQRKHEAHTPPPTVGQSVHYSRVRSARTTEFEPDARSYQSQSIRYHGPRRFMCMYVSCLPSTSLSYPSPPPGVATIRNRPTAKQQPRGLRDTYKKTFIQQGFCECL